MSKFNRSEWLNENELVEYVGFNIDESEEHTSQLIYIFGSPEIDDSREYVYQVCDRPKLYHRFYALWKKSTIDEFLEDLMNIEKKDHKC